MVSHLKKIKNEKSKLVSNKKERAIGQAGSRSACWGRQCRRARKGNNEEIRRVLKL